LLGNYSFDANFYSTVEISEISDGIENSNYLVKGEGRDFVLTIFEQQHPQLEQVFTFMAYGNQHHLPLPRLLKNQSGESLSRFEHEGETRFFILCEKLPGKHPENIDENLCEALGITFARIHLMEENQKILDHFPLRPLSFFLPDHAPVFRENHKQLLFEQASRDLRLLEEKSMALPKGLCHCDFFPDNSLVTSEGNNQKLSGLLDWYDMQHADLLLDLAIIAVSWCKDEQGLVSEKVNALLSAYQQTRTLDKKELLLWNEYLKAAAFIFWVSRELYVQKMKEEGREVLAHKDPEEFYTLLGQL